MLDDAVGRMSRRSFLAAILLGSASTLAAACSNAGSSASKPAAGADAKPTTAPAATVTAGKADATAVEVAAKAEATTAPAPPQVKPVPKELFFNYGSNHEMRWENMARHELTTPNELFFIRSHTKTPQIDPASWRLMEEGSGVAQPLELTLDELKAIPSVTVQ